MVQRMLKGGATIWYGWEAIRLSINTKSQKTSPKPLLYKELQQIFAAKFDVSAYAATTYDKFSEQTLCHKKYFVWHEIIFQKFPRFLLKASIYTV